MLRHEGREPAGREPAVGELLRHLPVLLGGEVELLGGRAPDEDTDVHDARDPFRSVGNGVVWRAPDGLVWLFYVVRYGDTMLLVTAVSTNTWSLYRATSMPTTSGLAETVS